MESYSETTPHNKISDCLFLDASASLAPGKPCVLNVTASFDHQTVPILGGKLTIGITGGDLRMELNHTKLDELLVTSDFSWFVDKTNRTDRKQQSSGTKSSGVVTGLKGPKLDVKAEAKSSSTSASETDVSVETKYESWQVNALSGSNPGWRFRLVNGEDYFVGNISKKPFARLVAQDDDSSVDIQFTTEQRYIHTEIVEGYIWDKEKRDIRRLRIANLYLWHKVIKPLVTPYVSKVRIVGGPNGK